MTEKIDVSKIKDKPDNIRMNVDDVSDLMRSIKEVGLLHPIGVCKKDGYFEILYGHRRFRAVKNLGFEKIECSIYDDKSKVENTLINAIENVQQKTITPVELGRVVDYLKTEGMSIKEISVRLGASPAKIKTCYDLYTQLPKKYYKNVGSGNQGNTKSGKVSVNALNLVSRMARRYNLNRKEANNLMELANKKEITAKQVVAVPYLLKKENMSLSKAVQKSLDFVAVDVTVMIDRNVLEEQKKINSISSTSVALGILTNKIKVNKSDYILKPRGTL